MRRKEELFQKEQMKIFVGDIEHMEKFCWAEILILHHSSSPLWSQEAASKDGKPCQSLQDTVSITQKSSYTTFMHLPKRAHLFV